MNQECLNKLTEYLRESDSDSITLSFEEIEKIIGEELSKEAKSNPNWWNNKNNPSRAPYWTAAGYKTVYPEGFLEEGLVYFSRLDNSEPENESLDFQLGAIENENIHEDQNGVIEDRTIKPRRNVLETIKYLYKSFRTWIDDAFKNPMIYYYQRTLIKLTIIMLIAAFIVIRGSTAPLLIDNSVMRFLFCSSTEEDKTLYNIGISVIAAYIFYLVQVYIPEKANLKTHFLFSDEHRNEIYLLNQCLLAWEEFYDKENRVFRFHEFSYKLSNGDGGSVTKVTYIYTIEHLDNTLRWIYTNPRFLECDLAYREFIRDAHYTIKRHLGYMDDLFLRWSDVPLDGVYYEDIRELIIKDFKRIQNRLSSIEHYYLEVVEIYPYKESAVQKEVISHFKG